MRYIAYEFYDPCTKELIIRCQKSMPILQVGKKNENEKQYLDN